MSGSSESCALSTVGDVAKHLTRLLLHETNFLPDYLQRHWAVVLAFTTSAAAATAVYKYLADHRYDPKRIEIAVFHIIRQYEARPNRQELLHEPERLIAEMDSEVSELINFDIVNHYEGACVAKEFRKYFVPVAFQYGGRLSDERQPFQTHQQIPQVYADKMDVDGPDTPSTGGSSLTAVNAEDSAVVSPQTLSPQENQESDPDESESYFTPPTSAAPRDGHTPDLDDSDAYLTPPTSAAPRGGVGLDYDDSELYSSSPSDSPRGYGLDYEDSDLYPTPPASAAPRNGYGLDYDDSEVYPTSPSSPSQSAPSLSSEQRRSSASKRKSGKGKSVSVSSGSRIRESSDSESEEGSVDPETDTETLTPETATHTTRQDTEVDKIGLDQKYFSTPFGKWPNVTITYSDSEDGEVDSTEVDFTPVVVSPIPSPPSSVREVSPPLPPSFQSPSTPSSVTSSRASTSSPPDKVALPSKQAATTSGSKKLPRHARLNTMVPPYVLIEKQAPASCKGNSAPRRRRTKLSHRGVVAQSDGSDAVVTPRKAKAKGSTPPSRKSERVNRYQGSYSE